MEYRTFFSFSLALALAITSHASETRVIYQARFSSEGLTAFIDLNGVPLDGNRPANMTEWKETLNFWIFSGANLIRLKLQPRTDLPADSDSGARIEVIENTIVEGAEPKEKILGSLDWKPAKGKGWPQSVQIPFHAKPPFSTDWEWRQGDVLTAKDIADPALQAFIGSIHSALKSRDYRKLKPLLEVKTREMAAAYQIPLAERSKDQDEFFRETFQDKQWGMLPLDWSAAKGEFYADGRILKLQAVGGKELLRSKESADGSEFSIPLWLYRKGGWRIAR